MDGHAEVSRKATAVVEKVMEERHPECWMA